MMFFNDLHKSSGSATESKGSYPSSMRLATESEGSLPSSMRTVTESEESHPSSMGADGSVARLASQHAVVIFAASNCSWSHTMKMLLSDMGVRWTVYELDKDPRGEEIEMELASMVGQNPPVPALFIGGKLVGTFGQVMALHLSGELAKLLREVGAMCPC